MDGTPRSGSDVIIRPATISDCPDIVRLIKELADHRKNCVEPQLTQEDLERDGFGSVKHFRCLVAGDVDGHEKAVGFALFFNSYSTVVGRTLYLQAIFVTREYRNRKIGLRLCQALAKIAVEEKCRQINFKVSSWNEPSIEFYRKLGAINTTEMEDWHLYRIREGLQSLANLKL